MAEEVAILADFKGKNFSFARGVYDYVMKKEKRDFPVKLTDILKTNFKDGEFKLRIADNIRRGKCYLIHDSNKMPCEWYTELDFVLEALTFSSPAEVNVVMPYTRFARQDRKESSRVSVNAKALAMMVSRYCDRGMTVDLHNPTMQEYFDCPFDNLYSFPSLIDFLQEKHLEILQELVVVSPDLGGGKRVESLVKRLNKEGVEAGVSLGYKTRKKENDVEKILITGSVKGKNCLVVDDIIDTGNTIIKTCEVLREKGAKKVYAYGTHGLFTEGIEKFSCFDRVLVSDSLKNEETKNLEIVSLVNLFGEAIYRTIVGQSLASLFDS